MWENTGQKKLRIWTLFTQWVILGILPLKSFILALREALVAKLAVSGISRLTSLILVFREVLVAKLVISCILSSIFFILTLYTSILATSFFITSLSLFKLTRPSSSLSTSNSFTLLF